VDGLDRDQVAALLAVADELLAGRGQILGSPRTDLAAPDWEADGAPYGSPPRDLGDAPPGGRSLKHVWELSRHHTLTQLAAAYAVSGDERYAIRVAELLRGWWARYDAPVGIVWSSGVEAAERLLSWVWIRRLLDGWPGVSSLFEGDPAALRQLWLHQDLLARFPSRFTSANNHRLAEAAGLLAAASAFPWFAASVRWAQQGQSVVEDELRLQVTACGLQREQATEYHCFVLDLVLVSLAEATAAGRELREGTLPRLQAMADALAVVCDADGDAPRFGDGDESLVVHVDAVADRPSRASLRLAAACVGGAEGWPEVGTDLRAALVGRLSGAAFGRPSGDRRPMATSARRVAEDAGLIVLREHAVDGGEVYCALRAGSFGYLPIAAHAHADQLSLELRVGGRDVLVDPGTYSYEALPAWRTFLRSTPAHNTLTIDALDQAEAWGAFLWGTAPDAILRELGPGGAEQPTYATASHDGYLRLLARARHTRRVELAPDRVVITDDVDLAEPLASVDVAATFVLGPDLAPVDGDNHDWRAPDGTTYTVDLPGALSWERWRGDPHGSGWWSPRFGHLAPTWCLRGRGRAAGTLELVTTVAWRAP
jgi:uncharacterized heparinase superfamily protein